MEVINQRMSIRAFRDQEVEDQHLQQILWCGHQAPTAGNLQPWEFIVIKRQDMKEGIVQTTFVGSDEHNPQTQAWMLKAPVFIVVCANVERTKARYGNKGLESLIYLDISACVENMLLAAVDLHLASCYISGFREAELISTLQLPEGILPLAILPIGYPANIPEKRTKRDLREIIHYEVYGKTAKE
ncbi:MAG: nitroreductase family protein [Desulfitobacterium sp.]